MDFKLSTATLDGTGGLLASVEGDLDISTAEQLAQPTALAVSTGCHLVLDLSACPFIDSSGLRFVLRAYKALAAEGRAMAIVTDRPHVKKLLSMTAIDLSIPVFAELSEATAWLGADGTKGASFPAPSVGEPSVSFPGP